MSGGRWGRGRGDTVKVGRDGEVNGSWEEKL